MRSQALRADLLMLITAVIWGSAFVAQRLGMDNIGPFLYTGLRFALAHVSWPWVDECLAVYGKFLNALTRRRELSVEMFIDTTPGTPRIYRQEVLTKLMTIGYDVEHNILFGTDCVARGAPFVGLGFARDTSENRHVVDQVFPGGPADGRLQVGDELLWLEDDTRRWTGYEEIERGLRGRRVPPGT